MEAVLAELALCLLLIALGACFWHLHRDPGASPAMLWVWGWLFPFVAALFVYPSPRFASAPPLTHLFGPLLPAFLLAGAFAYGDERVPRWLLPAAVAFGALRWTLAALDQGAWAHGLALAMEPLGSLAAAALVFQANRGNGATRVQWLLPVVLVVVACVDANSAVAGLRGQELAPGVLWTWVVVGPIALGVQITAAGHRAREQGRRRLHEQARVEEALSESEERFRALTENAFDLIAETDAEGRITYTNPRFEDVVGRSRDALVGRSFLDLVNPDDHQAAARWRAKLLESGTASCALARWRTGGDGWRWIESTGKAFRAADGGVRLVLSCRDVTERQQIEEELRGARDLLERRVQERTSQLATSEERYRGISELSSDLSFAYHIEPDGGIVGHWVTDAFTRITGYTTEEVEEQGWEILAHPADRDAMRARIARFRPGDHAEFEGRIVTKSGEVRWLLTRVAIDRTAHGLLRVRGASRDVTERKQAEQDQIRLNDHLREVQRLESLGVLAGGIAHDFNNLLSVILGNSSLALADVTPGSPLHTRLSRVRAAARHASGLTDQMLTYSGKASVTLKAALVPRIVEDVLDLLRASISCKTTLETELDPSLPPIEGDETQVRQVVVNLVTNASEALEGAPGSVRIRTGVCQVDRGYLADTFGTADLPGGEYVYLEVADSGSGIDEARRARIFEPFFTTKFSGRGLGLAAVLGIVQQHGGAIKIQSAPERGSTFRVLFPKAAGPPRVAHS